MLLLANCCADARCQSPTAPSAHVVEMLSCNRLIHYVRPVYPKDAKRRHIQGTVKLRAVIGESGELRNIEVVEGDPMLVPAAQRAVKKWRYSPCLLNGSPIEPVTSINVPFILSQ